MNEELIPTERYLERLNIAARAVLHQFWPAGTWRLEGLDAETLLLLADMKDTVERGSGPL